MISKSKFQRIALYLYMFSIHFEVYDLTGMGILSVTKIVAFIYMLSIIPDFKFFIDLRNIRQFVNPAFLLFILMVIMSLININSVSSSFFDFTLMLNIFLFWVMINHERRDSGILDKSLYAFVFGSLTLTLLYTFNIGISYESDRITIFDDNQNSVAIKISISIIILLFFGIQKLIDKKIILGIIALIPIPTMLSLMFETGSRKASIGLALAFVIGVLFLKTKNVMYKVLIIFLAFIGSVYMINLMMDYDIIFNRLERTAEQQDYGGRDEIWRNVFPLIIDNPIVGVGQTGYEMYSMGVFGNIRSPHNVLLEVLAYTGLIGLFIYLYLLYQVTWQGFKYYKIKGQILPLLLLIPMYGSILGGQALGNKLLWAIFAFAASRIFYTYSKKTRKASFV